MAANKMDEILKHIPDLEEGWKEMQEKLKTEPAEREMLSLRYRKMLQMESLKENLPEPEFTKAKRAESDSKVMKAEMPKRIYLFDCNDAMLTPLEGDTVYVREDAFIEKAAEFLYNYNQKQVLKHGARATLGCGEYTINVDEFRKYMEGE